MNSTILFLFAFTFTHFINVNSEENAPDVSFLEEINELKKQVKENKAEMERQQSALLSQFEAKYSNLKEEITSLSDKINEQQQSNDLINKSVVTRKEVQEEISRSLNETLIKIKEEYDQCPCKQEKIESKALDCTTGGLKYYFQNATLQSNITSYNEIAFKGLTSTEMAIVNNTPVYFLTDYNKDALIKMSESWQFIKKVGIVAPNMIKWANDHLYVSSMNGFHKIDYNFNLIKSVGAYRGVYTGIYHNSSDNTFAVAVRWRNRVDWTDADLTVLASLSFGNNSPVGVAAYGDSLYVSAYAYQSSTMIYVIRNRVIINTISICDETDMLIRSIVFDDCGYMALNIENEVRLYHINGTSTGFNLTFPSDVYHINFDYNKRMMISTLNALYFYN